MLSLLLQYGDESTEAWLARIFVIGGVLLAAWLSRQGHANPWLRDDFDPFGRRLDQSKVRPHLRSYWPETGRLRDADMERPPKPEPPPSPDELAAMRRRMDEILRARWVVLRERLVLLAQTPPGAGWKPLLEHHQGILDLHAQLRDEAQAARKQETYPGIALQLCGATETLGGVLKHAQQVCDPATPPGQRTALAEGVLQFLHESLPRIDINLSQSQPEGSGEVYSAPGASAAP